MLEVLSKLLSVSCRFLDFILKVALGQLKPESQLFFWDEETEVQGLVQRLTVGRKQKPGWEPMFPDL